MEYSINNGASWSSTLPTYNQTSSLTILASVVNAGGCRSASIAVGTTVPGTCPPDGITWTARTAAEANQWFSVTYGNGLFVAVAIGGTNQVMTSPDGITWTARTAAVANNWGSVTYGNGLFVAVAETGTNRVMTSPDGITWTARMAAEANQWWSVTYGNGLFVAVSLGGTNQVMTSPDGITWTARTAAAANQWRSLTYGNGLFVAVANTGTNRVMTSPDGITWTARTAAEANQWRSVTYGNGLFVAVSTDGINRVMTSPDGFTWSARTPAEANSSWQSVTYGNGLFVAVALNGTNRVITSPDGITWTARTAAEANLWRSVTYGNGLFVAVASSGTNRVMTSADGLPATWYLDADNDNYYTGSSVTQCTSPGAGYKTTGLIGGGDCNDANAAVNPGATEVCNGIDDDCDGSIDENNNTTLGTYSATSLVSGANTTITPSTAPTNTTSLFAYTNTNFTGVLSADPATGVVRATAARQAGIYPVTVLASNINGCTTTTTFTLTVTDPVCSQALFRGTATVVVQSRPLSVAIGDFDGDGKQDIAATNAGSNTVSIRLGDGNGAFSGTTNVAVQSSPQSVAIGDFNGDGKQDIAAANAGSNNVSIRLGEGNGAFSGTTNVAVQSSPRSVAIGDFNGDGRQDFATANSGVSTNTLSIRLGNGDGTFSGSTNVAVGLAPLSLAVGDFNGDGKQDIAAANSGSNTVSIRLGDGLGGFSVNPDVAVGILPQSVAIGDFNGDGKQDIVAANGSSNTVSIRLGDGAGRFSGSTDVAVDTNPISVAISDFNGDGKQDFATANTGSNTVSIRLGDGFGGFSGSTNVAIGSAPFSVAVGDFNGDGMQDFTTANQNSQTLAIRLGRVNEINVQGNSTSIADGDASPTLADHTDFGSVATGSSFARTFTIQNTGNVVLSISGISISGDNASEYVVTTAPDASVPAGGSRTFVVTFTPIAAGLRSATIRIANNDCDEAVYDFALQGTGCTNLALANSLDAATTSIVPGANHIFVSGDPCKVLVCITPNGANPVNGSVTSKVWVQPSTPTFNDRPYLLRHYEIAPATNAGTATARITLYATQADFNAFNDFQTNGNDLPAGPTDAIGIAELRIYKYSGTSSDGSGTPGSYTQPHTIIDPADADIVWNSVLNRWEISFDVVGFSGFFMGNSNGTILPLQLISFSGSKQATGNVLGWKTENEQNTRRFELERSANGSNFTRIATIAAAGAGSHRYSYTDAATQHGTVWYRLKMIDTDGKFSYSPVVIIQPAATDAITLFPNPAQNLVNISIGNRNLLNTTAQVIDAKGSLVQTIKLTGYNQQFNVGALAKGMYALKFSNGTVLRFVKE